MRLPLFCTTLSSTRALMGAALLAGTVGAGLANTGSASAALTYCRTDPIVHLANGPDVHLSVGVGDNASDVQQISYVVHVPSSSVVTGVTSTGSWANGKESVQVVADEPANTYVTDVTVQTGAPSAAVTATTKVPGLGESSVSGQSGSDLTTTVNG